MDVTGGIVGVVGGMLPGSGLLSAGLQMGGTILKKRAEKTEAKNLDDMIAGLTEDQTFLKEKLLELRKEVKEKEMNTNWEAIQQDLMQIIEEVKISHSKTTSELSSLTSLVEKTFDLVVELRFKVLYSGWSKKRLSLFMNVAEILLLEVFELSILVFWGTEHIYAITRCLAHVPNVATLV